MASRAVREVQALKIVNADLANDADLVNPSLNVNVETLADLESIPEAHPWVLQRVSWHDDFSMPDHAIVVNMVKQDCVILWNFLSPQVWSSKSFLGSDSPSVDIRLCHQWSTRFKKLDSTFIFMIYFGSGLTYTMKLYKAYSMGLFLSQMHIVFLTWLPLFATS